MKIASRGRVSWAIGGALSAQLLAGACSLGDSGSDESGPSGGSSTGGTGNQDGSGGSSIGGAASGGGSSGGSSTGGSGNTGGLGGGGLGGGGSSCTDLPEDECTQEQECTPIFGYEAALGENGMYVGCRYWGPPDNHTTCGTAITCGYPGDDEEDCLMFPDDCLPDGWTPIVTCSEVPSCPTY